MRLVTLVRVLALAGLAVATSLTTSQLLAYYRSAPSVPIRPVQVGERTEPVTDLTASPPATGTEGRIVADFALIGLVLAPGDDGVDLAVAAEIMDLRPNVRYLWHVTTGRSEGTAVSDHWYLDRVFMKTVETEFVGLGDLLDLGPGTHNVVVRLYEFPEDTDIALALGDQDRLQTQHMVLQQSARVTVSH